MKTLGYYSLASFIKFIISAAWYIQLFFLIFLTFAITIKFFKNGTTEPTPETVEVRLTKSKTIAVPATSLADKLSNATLQLEEGKLTFNHQSSKKIIGFNLLFMWVAFGITLSITFQLRKIFQSLAQNNPFVVQNAQRLRLIAFLIMSIAVIDLAYATILNWFLKQNFILPDTNIRALIKIDLETIFTGLIMLIIAEIFRIGAQMKEEQELTV